MEKNLSAYLFVRQGKLQKSPAGERDLNRGELAAVKAFFEAGRQSELYTLLQRLLCRMRRFRELRRHDYAIEPADCVEDLCAQAPVMASALADRPDESAAEIELRHLFLLPEHQRQIMFSGSRILIRTLVWWGRRILGIWQDVFGCKPDVFAAELECRL